MIIPQQTATWALSSPLSHPLCCSVKCKFRYLHSTERSIDLLTGTNVLSLMPWHSYVPASSNCTLSMLSCCPKLSYRCRTGITFPILFHVTRGVGLQPHSGNTWQSNHLAATSKPISNCNQVTAQKLNNRYKKATNKTRLPKVIWEDGRLAALSHTYTVKSQWLQWRAQNLPPKVHLPVDQSQTPPRASSPDPSDLWWQTASGSDLLFFHNALDRPTHRPTDHPQKVWSL